jgi:hypothetical protein
MADVTTYKRCISPHVWNNRVFHVGDTLPAGDAATTQNPQWWVALADADMTTDGKKQHQW